MSQTPRHPARAAPIALRVLGTGEYIPSQRFDTAEFDTRFNKPAGWTRRHVGIDFRQFASRAEPASLMAAGAASMALQAAGMTAAQMDCIVSAAGVGEQPIPCTAVLVHQRLGLAGSGIPAFDVNATCLGFLSALDLVASAIAVGRYRTALIVASEVPSAGLNWDDPDTAPLFGDGAAAVVVTAGTPGDGSALVASHMETYSEGAQLCRIRAGGTNLRIGDGLDEFSAGSMFEMSGRATYRLAAQLLPGFLERLFARAGIGQDDIDCFIPHQASAKALQHLQAALRLPANKVVRILETHGNQLAASIPIALHHAISSGQVQRGDLLALLGSGAGLSFGGAVLRY